MGLWDNPPYYLTAYGLAVKHGFIGSEKQWLKSLKGDPGKDLLIADTFETYEDLLERYPGTVGIPEGFMKVGTETDYLLYYWDETDLCWYSIRIIGPAGADGKSAYELAVLGGYTGTEAEFEADLKNFKTWKADAVAAKSAAETAAGTAQTSAQQAAASAVTAAEKAGAAAASETAASGSAQSAAASREAAQEAARAAEAYAEQAEASVGDASWILFGVETEAAGKIGWLYAIESEHFEGADFTLNDDNGSHQGWLEVSYT